MTEHAWIRKVQRKGDERAANELVSFYYRPIYAFVYRQTFDKELSLDLTQEIFIGMLQSIQGFDHERGSFKSWLYRIATNHVVDYFRSRSYKYERIIDSVEDVDVPEHYDFTVELEYREVIEKAGAFVNELDSFSQQVMRLKLFAEYTFQEIASLLERPESSVKTRYYTVMKKLKEEMEAERVGG
ncbi:sigma-70 family RNA polymerase sigma factor [Mesobacillus subterraneus]|uniref:RNA polymerase sigma factor n=1 Tax=Mesobacillus subterraneus TaxID=285983 RepID=UPI001CFECEDF|nr:sigma-70 family RNA polymerase sigma factor [Mesobacillus subterraneus]WLR54571.1 sigma-70 family RNA polymerase sigma factor [Mesobacillus subterraneus]